ncbi:MAG: hypothetical protein HKN43_05110 [Rhodothermales bacterium]|nr:hypothetical protein [Rhodothermales bacterium]
MHWLEEARIIVLSAYVCTAASLTIISIARRLQVRHVLYSGRFLFGRSVLVTCVTIVPIAAIIIEPAIVGELGLGSLVGYLLGSVCWIVTSRINNSILITRHGIVFPPGISPSRLGWSQISDYFVNRRLWRSRFTIIWRDEEGAFRRLQFRTSPRMVDRIDRAVETRGTMQRPLEKSRELTSVA